MAFATNNLAKNIMPGFGMAGNDGASSVAVTGTGQPTTDNAATTAQTSVSNGTCNHGYVQVNILSVDTTVKIVSMFITVTDGTTTQSVGSYNPASADQTNGRPVSLLVPFISDLAVNRASVRIVPSGTKTGSIEYQVDIALYGNLGMPVSGNAQL